MVKACCGPGGGGSVTGVALSAGNDVGNRLGLGILANVTAAVASRALSCHTRVVHSGRGKDHGCWGSGMAGITGGGSGNVAANLARCPGAVMTGLTATICNIDVVITGGCPRSHLVA
jgi:hypothetical protein